MPPESGWRLATKGNGVVTFRLRRLPPMTSHQSLFTFPALPSDPSSTNHLSLITYHLSLGPGGSLISLYTCISHRKPLTMRKGNWPAALGRADRNRRRAFFLLGAAFSIFHRPHIFYIPAWCFRLRRFTWFDCTHFCFLGLGFLRAFFAEANLNQNMQPL